MKRASILAAVIFAVIAAVISIPTASAENDFTIGATAENFKLSDTNGAKKSLNDLKGKNGAIVVFLSVQCPVVRAYNERIGKLAEDYKAKGINVIGINSNSTETADAVKKHAEANYKFPVLLDKGNVVADKFGASATPEMLFFDAKNKLVYRGAIDNDRSGENVTTKYLRNALDENLAGKTITKAETKAFGCSIKRAGA